jgi:hypothetical protein
MIAVAAKEAKVVVGFWIYFSLGLSGFSYLRARER